MKLYYSPGACSLADHIALHEAGLSFDRVKVDLRSHTTEAGDDYYAVNPKGYVPALELDGGEVLTENIAILEWISRQVPSLAPQGELGRSRLLEALAYISTEVHKGFKPFFAGGSDEDKAKAGQVITKRLEFLAEQAGDGYLFGHQPSVADAYLFVMLLWAGKMGVQVPSALEALKERMMQRDAVRMALEHEGLSG